MIENYKITHVHTAANEYSESSILVIYTGGTLGMDYDETGTSLVPFDFVNILEKVPELKRFDFKLTVLEPFFPVDSSNISIPHWLTVAKIIYEQYDDYNAFIVLHGTDTMAYSACALSFLLENLSKPVIFTGAQLPIGAKRTDARENLITALEIASMRKAGKPMISEVCVFFDYLLLRGNRSSKVQSMNFAAFESPNYPHLAEAGIYINFNENSIAPPSIQPLKLYQKMNSEVAVLKVFPGISKSLVEAVLQQERLGGLILETFGAGNVPTEKWLEKALTDALDKGIHLFNVSQSAGGRVEQGKYKTSLALKEMGVVSGGDITPEAAVVKMMFLLANEEEPSRLRKRLAVPICGEMSLPHQ